MKTEFREGDVVRSLLDGMFYRVLSVGEGSVSAASVEEEEADGKRIFIRTPADTIEVNHNVFRLIIGTSVYHWVYFLLKMILGISS